MDVELINMSVEDFCKAIGITEKRFNKKLKKAKKFLGYQPQDKCIEFTKLSFCPYGYCPYCISYIDGYLKRVFREYRDKEKEC